MPMCSAAQHPVVQRIHAVVFCRWLGGARAVFAFEPEPANLELLAANLAHWVHDPDAPAPVRRTGLLPFHRYFCVCGIHQ